MDNSIYRPGEPPEVTHVECGGCQEMIPVDDINEGLCKWCYKERDGDKYVLYPPGTMFPNGTYNKWVAILYSDEVEDYVEVLGFYDSKEEAVVKHPQAKEYVKERDDSAQ